jgi:ABC-type multidrug transport system fused ATPase/permease subunit
MPIQPPVLTLLLRLWRHIRPSRRKQFIWLLGLMVLASIAEVVTLSAVLPFLMALMTPDKVFGHPMAQTFISALGVHSPGELLLTITVFFAIAALIGGGIRVLLLWANTRLSCVTGADFSIEIYRRTLYQPYSVHVARNTSEVIGGVTIKANHVISNVVGPVLVLISSAFMLFSILATLLFVDYQVAVAAFVGFGLIYGLIGRATKKRLKANSDRIGVELDRAIKALQEGLGGIRDVLIDGSQNTYCDLYREADLRMRYAQANTLFISQCPRYLIEALGMVLITTIAYALARAEGGFGSALPLMGALALGAQRLLPVIQQSYAAWSSIYGGQRLLLDTLELLDQQLPGHANLPPPCPMPFRAECSLSNVSFRYTPNTPWVLRDINLTIVKGSRIGFIGKTGSGKSTLLDIIMGLLKPTQGRLEIDGVAVAPENLRAWQRLVAHVPQMIYLTDSSVAENIAFGQHHNDIDLIRVRDSARKAQIADLIESWPAAYETPVGERGVKLSGGQRQRIGIARALYKQAQIIIFDEATSALDNETEEAVMQSIENLGPDLTILVIAHRLTTLRICDEVVELDSQVIRRRGSYAQIVSSIP